MVLVMVMVMVMVTVTVTIIVILIVIITITNSLGMCQTSLVSPKLSVLHTSANDSCVHQNPYLPVGADPTDCQLCCKHAISHLGAMQGLLLGLSANR